MPRYKTGLYEIGDSVPHDLEIRARGWRLHFNHLTTRRANLDAEETPNPDDLYHLRAAVAGGEQADGSYETTYAPELVVETGSRLQAQRAVNLIVAARSILLGAGEEDASALPEDPNNLEDLDEDTYWLEIGHRRGGPAWMRSAKLAAKSTSKARWTYAIARLWSSNRSCSVDWIEHHPEWGSRFRVDNDPLNHSTFAQAIVSAYSAIEQLGLEVRANQQNPAQINGHWNPVVLNDLVQRLQNAYVATNREFVWTVRNSPTRIERGRPPPQGRRAQWARGWIRDRHCSIPDAIKYASFLRSRVAAHANAESMKSLTMYDVNNVQSLARRLILETMGFWTNN